MAIPKVTPTQADLNSTKPGGKLRADKHAQEQKKRKKHHHVRHERNKGKKHKHRAKKQQRKGPVNP